MLHFVTPPLESLRSPAVQGERFTPLSGTDAETANARLHHIETYLRHTDDAQSNAYLQQEAAHILYRLGRFTDSQTYAEQAATGFEQAGNALSAAHAKGKIADILEARGRLDEALAMWQTEVEPVLTRLGYAADADVARRRMADLQTRLRPH